MQMYQEGLLRKATALSEVVQRGLMAPLDSRLLAKALGHQSYSPTNANA